MKVLSHCIFWQEIMKVCPYNLNSLYVSAVTKVLEPVKDQVHQELAQKLTATDSLLKDNIGKMVRSKVCRYILMKKKALND